MSRKVYLDYLRFFGAFAIVFLHVSSANWYIADMNGIEWKALNIYDGLFRWGVPVFTMISGALFLSKDISIKKIYSKYILRLLIAFIFWSIIYTIVNVFVVGQFNLIDSINFFIRGNYHMWYILMIMGLYMCIPIFKLIVKDKKIMKYFLCLSFIFAFVIPYMINLVQDFVTKESILSMVASVSKSIDTMGLNIFSCYAFYFVFGYYLSNIDLEKKNRIIIYFLGIIGFLLTIILTMVVTINKQSYTEMYYMDYSINVFLESLFAFILIKYIKFNNKKINNLIEKSAKYCFGIYLIHPLIIKVLESVFNIHSLSFNTFISVPLIALLVFTVSYIISMILNHIPVIKKYCV